MLNIIKNKKGFIASSIVLLICFVTFFVVALIFYILFSFAGKLSVYDIESDQQAISGYGLSSYLKTPLELNGNNINVGDLIAAYYMEEDRAKKEEYRQKIEDVTKDQLNKLEYTYRTQEYNIETIRGFMVFVTDDLSERWGGTSVAKDRKFMSKNAIETFPKAVVTQALPLPNSNKIYVLWIETAKRVE